MDPITFCLVAAGIVKAGADGSIGPKKESAPPPPPSREEEAKPVGSEVCRDFHGGPRPYWWK